MEINELNVEHYIIEYIEGSLNDEAAQKLLKFIKEHADYQKLLEDYKATILIDDQAIIFEEKESLFKNSEALILPKSKSNKQFYLYRAAAILCLCLLSYVAFRNMNDWIAKDNNAKIVTQREDSDSNTNTQRFNIAKEKPNEALKNKDTAPKKSNLLSSHIAKSSKNISGKLKETNTNDQIVYVEKIAKPKRNFQTKHVQYPKLNEYQIPQNTGLANNDVSNKTYDIKDNNSLIKKIGTDIAEKEIVLIVYENIKEKINSVSNIWNQTSIKFQFGDQSIYLKK